MRVQKKWRKVKKPPGKTDISEMSKASYERQQETRIWTQLQSQQQQAQPIFPQPFRITHPFLIYSHKEKRKKEKKRTHLVPLLNKNRIKTQQPKLFCKSITCPDTSVTNLLTRASCWCLETPQRSNKICASCHQFQKNNNKNNQWKLRVTITAIEF